MAMTANAHNGVEKVALLLQSLPKEVVDKVMQHMDARHAGLVKAELSKAKNLPKGGQEELFAVLEEAVGLLQANTPPKPKESAPAKAGANPAAPTPGAHGQYAETTKVDIQVGGEPIVKLVHETATEETIIHQTPLDPNVDPLQALASLPADSLARALDSENTRTISLLLNSLELDSAGRVYKKLSPAKRREVSMRFSEQAVVGAALIKHIAEGVYKKASALPESPGAEAAPETGRERRMAVLLRGLERTERQEMLTTLEKTDAELAGRIKAQLYQFEDILLMENTSVQKMLADVDMKTLALALHGAPPEIEGKTLANLSKRAQESLKEELSLTGKVPEQKVRQARDAMVEAIQKLDQRNDLVMKE
jgi:flagellar motor switch protein FliG